MSRAEAALDIILDPPLTLPDNSSLPDSPVLEEACVASLEDDPVAKGIQRAKDSIEGEDAPRSPSRYVEEPILPGIQSVHSELHALLTTPCLTPQEQARRTESLRKEWNVGMLALRTIRFSVLKERARVRGIVRAALASVDLENS